MLFFARRDRTPNSLFIVVQVQAKGMALLIWQLALKKAGRLVMIFIPGKYIRFTCVMLNTQLYESLFWWKVDHKTLLKLTFNYTTTNGLEVKIYLRLFSVTLSTNMMHLQDDQDFWVFYVTSIIQVRHASSIVHVLSLQQMIQDFPGHIRED